MKDWPMSFFFFFFAVVSSKVVVRPDWEMKH